MRKLPRAFSAEAFVGNSVISPTICFRRSSRRKLPFWYRARLVKSLSLFQRARMDGPKSLTQLAACVEKIGEQLAKSHSYPARMIPSTAAVEAVSSMSNQLVSHRLIPPAEPEASPSAASTEFRKLRRPLHVPRRQQSFGRLTIRKSRLRSQEM